jgi:UDP:flavonoid glycosyltransferase YjiC (YdhE family)
MRRRLKVLVSAFAATGHVFPALALSRRLRARGHEVWLETEERWREVVEEQGLRLIPAPEHIALPRPEPGMPTEPTLAEASMNLVPVLREIGPDVVVNDFFTQPATLAAEREGMRRATLIPHPYPVYEPGLPYTYVGLIAPRTRAGALAWRAARPWFARHARRERRELNEVRAELGLEPLRRDYGGISEQLAMVATFPKLEYPRRWPAHVHVTGPMLFELPHREVELPDGNRPLVLVAGSTALDQELRLVHATLHALSEEPVRVLAVLNQRGREWQDPLPSNATVLDWASYSQVMPRASVVVCNGGHGTVVRSLAEGVPLVCRPAGGDQSENGARVAWAGAGLMVPRRLLGGRPLRWSVRRVLGDPRFAIRAAAFARCARHNDGAERGAELVERHAEAP